MPATIRSLSGLASAAIVTAIVVFGVQTPGQGQASRDRDVRVINTATEPVPATIVGTPTVGLAPDANGVMIQNSILSPVMVRDSAVATRVPFRAGAALIIPPAQTVAAHDFLVVPTGKRFVLEGASAYAMAPGQQFLARVLVNELGEGVQQIHLPLRHQGTWANSGDQYVATEQITLVLNAGGQLTVQFVRDLPAGSAFAEATVFGYFEDVP